MPTCVFPGRLDAGNEEELVKLRCQVRQLETDQELAQSQLRSVDSKLSTAKEEVRTRGLAAYASSVSFGHPEHCFLTVWTPKNLCQNLLMMTFLRR